MLMFLYQSKQTMKLFLPGWSKCSSSKYTLFQRMIFTKRNFLKRRTINSALFTFKRLPNFSKSITTRKEKPVISDLKKLLVLAKPERWRLTGAVILLLVSSAVTMAVPFCIGKFIDIITSSSDQLKENLFTFCTALVVILAFGAVANFGRVYLINMSSHSVINSLRKRAYASILNQETGFFDRANTGELVNRLSADTTTVGMSVTNNISDGLRSTFALIAASSLMVYTSPQLAFLGLITVAPVAIIAAVFGKFLKKNSQYVQDALARATQVAEERISSIRTVQAFAKIQDENALYSSKINSIMHFALKESLARAVFFGLTGFSGNLIALSVLYYGGLMINEDQMTVGSLYSFLMYAVYVGISIGGLSTFYSELMRGLGASSRLWELIDREPLIPLKGGVSLPFLKGNVNFENVTFAYPSRPDIPVLTNFNLSIPAGSVYAIVGPSGCGKSTVGSLLLRFYDSQKGVIALDDTDIRTLNVQWLRKNIGLVSQEPVLFSFSIRENVLYGAANKEDIDDVALKKILLKANAFEFVQKFPHGLDTLVGERGVMLSGGQRQRIAIARALLKNPKILILDEATSALDAESEYLVQNALEELMKERTVITIAHRLSTVRKADVIIVLENGNVIEQGKYEELVSKGGSFYHLVKHQNLIS